MYCCSYIFITQTGYLLQNCNKYLREMNKGKIHSKSWFHRLRCRTQSSCSGPGLCITSEEESMVGITFLTAVRSRERKAQGRRGQNTVSKTSFQLTTSCHFFYLQKTSSCLVLSPNDILSLNLTSSRCPLTWPYLQKTVSYLVLPLKDILSLDPTSNRYPLIWSYL